MPHPTTSIGDTQYVAKFNAYGAALDRRLTQNCLVNAQHNVWQRGTTFAAAGARVPCADYWALYRTGLVAGATVTRQVPSLAGYSFCSRVQRDNANASTAVVNYYQTMESIDVTELQGLPLTLAFWARCGANYSAASSLMVPTVITGTGTDGNPAVGFTGQANAASGSVTLTTSWQLFLLQVPTLASNITQLAVNFAFTPVGTAGANDYFEVTGTPLVIGDYVGQTPWRTFHEERLLCLHRYWKSFPYATAPASNLGIGIGTLVYGLNIGGAVSQNLYPLRFPVPMYTGAQVVTFYNPSAANAFFRNQGRATDATVTAAFVASADGFVPSLTGLVAWTAGDTIAVNVAVDSEP